LAKSLDETKAIIAGPQLAAEKLKSDSCIMECTKVLDETTSKAIAAKADEEALKGLKGYLYDTVINNYGPIGSYECNCPEPCSVDEAAAVKKLGKATGSMRDLGNQLQDLIDSGEDNESEGKKAEAAEMEKSMDSGVLHVSCGLTKQPQKCSDELSALARTTTETKTAVWYLQHESVVKPAPALDSVIYDCSRARLTRPPSSTSWAAYTMRVGCHRQIPHGITAPAEVNGKEAPKKSCISNIRLWILSPIWPFFDNFHVEF
jgi:hypothetical protein